MDWSWAKPAGLAVVAGLVAVAVFDFLAGPLGGVVGLAVLAVPAVVLLRTGRSVGTAFAATAGAVVVACVALVVLAAFLVHQAGDGGFIYLSF